MLVLSRRKGESIVIDVEDGIEITVLEAGPGSVRLGIRAPRSVDVWRKEVILKVTEANRSAAESASGDAKRLSDLLKARQKTKANGAKEGEKT
jgi:carbon storage regulator